MAVDGEVLRGVVALVHCPADQGTRDALSGKLARLGARVASRLTKDCTHVVYKGKLALNAADKVEQEAELWSLYDRINKIDLPPLVVGVRWIAQSEAEQRRALEREFVVRRPADPSLINKLVGNGTPGSASGGKKRARRTAGAGSAPPPPPRAKENYEVDAGDFAFSSSQQISDARAAPPQQRKAAPAPPPPWRSPNAAKRPNTGQHVRSAACTPGGGSARHTPRAAARLPASASKPPGTAPRTGGTMLALAAAAAASARSEPPARRPSGLREGSTPHLRQLPMRLGGAGGCEAAAVPMETGGSDAVHLAAAQRSRAEKQPEPAAAAAATCSGLGDGGVGRQQPAAATSRAADVPPAAAARPPGSGPGPAVAGASAHDGAGSGAPPTECRESSPCSGGVLGLTSVYPEIGEVARAAVRRLRGMRLCADGGEATATHLVVGKDRRTLKVLLAIANGAWLLAPEWLTASLEAGAWLDEAPYTVPGVWSEAAARARCAKEAVAAGAAAPAPLLQGELVHVTAAADDRAGAANVPPLRRLVAALAGRASPARSATLCVVCGQQPARPAGLPAGVPVVREEWLLSCAEEHSLLDKSRGFAVE